jgi:hypothetical protein
MVVLHPTQESYLAAVGQDAGGTAGSSVVQRLKECIAKRRIDLRGDCADYLTAALPHELTHVVLADHFSGQSLPRWADEGMAMLADSRAKQDLHARDLREARDLRTTIRLMDLLPSVDYPSSQQWGAFYGQSLSVVDYLVHRGTPQKFVQFLDAARAGGYDRALLDNYGIHGTQELDRLWTATLSQDARMVAKDR